MSKSLGNYVGIAEPPNEMFGKLMSIPDGLMRRYFELCTEVDLAEVDRRLDHDHPRDNKFWLGREIITIYHGAAAAQAAQDEFVKVFSNKENPSDMQVVRLARELAPEGRIGLAKLLVATEAAPSNKEARRLIEQGAVQWNGVKVTDPGELVVGNGGVLKVGRRFCRVEIGDPAV